MLNVANFFWFSVLEFLLLVSLLLVLLVLLLRVVLLLLLRVLLWLVLLLMIVLLQLLPEGVHAVTPLPINIAGNEGAWKSNRAGKSKINWGCDVPGVDQVSKLSHFLYLCLSVSFSLAHVNTQEVLNLPKSNVQKQKNKNLLHAIVPDLPGMNCSAMSYSAMICSVPFVANCNVAFVALPFVIMSS